MGRPPLAGTITFIGSLSSMVCHKGISMAGVATNHSQSEDAGGQTAHGVGAVGGYDLEGDSYVFHGSEADVRIEFLAADVVNVRLDPDGAARKDSPAIFTRDLGGSDVTVEDRSDSYLLTSDELHVYVDKTSGRVTFADTDDTVITRDTDQGMTWDDDGRIRMEREVAGDESFYGLGEKTGALDKRGEHLTQWTWDANGDHAGGTDEMYQAHPFYIGLHDDAAYGLFLDNTFRTTFAMAENGADKATVTADGGQLNYYFLKGPAMRHVVERFTELTGRMPLPPRWSLGNHQCKWSYFPETTVREIADGFRQRDIPLDAIWLDIDYMDQYRVFTWDPQRFPDPETMIKDLKDQGIRTVTIIDPGVDDGANYDVYAEGMKEGYFITDENGEVFHAPVWPKSAAFPDFTREEVRQWWGDLYGRLTDAGIAGVWNDMNEPAIIDTYKTMPDDMEHHGDLGDVKHNEAHNVYGMYEDMATYEGMLRANPDERPFVLTRSGFSGIQRYAAVWTGDNRSKWEHLDMGMPMMENMGLSGMAFIGTDIGGFGADCTPELYARWLQFGAFSPFCRTHSSRHTREQEPWTFGQETEDIARDYLTLRYRLMPYTYDAFRQASETGIPVMRPLVLDHQNDPNVRNLSNEFMYGDVLLVAPVTEEGARERDVYLPEGRWVDYWTGEIHDGRQTVVRDAPVDTMPLYVKQGSIVPMGPAMQYTDEKPTEELELHVYADDRAEGRFYEDDGHSFGFKQGEYNLTEFAYRNDTGTAAITVDRVHEGYATEVGTYKLVIHSERDVTGATVNGQDTAVARDGDAYVVEVDAGAI